MSKGDSPGEALRQFRESNRPPTLKERFVGVAAIVGVIVFVVGLTLGATAFLALCVSEEYVGAVVIAGGGIQGTYVVTSVDVGWQGGASSVGTFSSDDGSIVLRDAKLSWDASDVGTELPATYVPSLRDGHLPIVVSEGVAGDVILPLIFGIVALPIAVGGWWLIVAAIVECTKHSLEPRSDDDQPSPSDADVPQS